MKVGGVCFGDGAGDNSGKFGVHGYVGMGFDQFADDGHFLFDVFFPDVANFEGFAAKEINSLVKNK